jgi:hypothetical protein
MLREKHRLWVVESRVLKVMIGPKREEEKGDWRKLHNRELLDLYPSPNIINVIKPSRIIWAGYIARMGSKRYAYKVLVRKRKGKRPFKT